MTWTEAITEKGETYYFNSKTGESTWTRPEGVPVVSHADSLRSTADSSKGGASALPGANAMAQAKISGSTSSTANVAGSWRELTSQDGRKYYINTVTKVTVWDMPPEYREFVERQQNKGAAASVDKKTAEDTFMRILREAGVKSDWEWEQALRLIIDHPSYKCIPTLFERKEVFAKYKLVEKARERDERFNQMQLAREAFRKMLDEESRIQVGTRWSEAMEYLKERAEYLAITSPRDRIELFEEYIAHLKRTRGTERKVPPALVKFGELLRSIPEISLETTWKEAIQLFSAHETYTFSPEVQRLDPIDLLLEYENYFKEMEEAEVQAKRQAHLVARRKERLAREEMQKIIKELVDSGQFTALTTWQEFYRMTSANACFEEMITSHPSDPTPLDFYWDALDELQYAYIPDRRLILEAVGWEFPKELRKFQEVVRKDPKFPDIKGLHHIELVFRELSIRKDLPAVLAQQERKAPDLGVDRQVIDRYKKLIKHWSSPPITLESTYENLRPFLESHQEFKDLEAESVRKLYFDKFIHHLKRKAGLLNAAAEPKIPYGKVSETKAFGAPKDGEDSPEEGEVLEPVEEYRPLRSRAYY